LIAWVLAVASTGGHGTIACTAATSSFFPTIRLIALALSNIIFMIGLTALWFMRRPEPHRESELDSLLAFAVISLFLPSPPPQVHMRLNRLLRISLRAIIIIAGILILTWMVLLLYVNVKQKDLIEKITQKITERTHAPATIGDLSVSLIRTFPNLTLQLSDVVVNDSLSAVHKKTFLRASDIYLHLGVLSLLQNNPQLKSIRVRNGNLYLFADSSGSSTTYIFKKNETKKKGGTPPDIYFQNVTVTVDNPQRYKLHQANFRRLKVRTRERDGNDVFLIETDMKVTGLAFNLKAGTYLSNKTVEGKFQIINDRKESKLVFDNAGLLIDDHPFIFNGFYRTLEGAPEIDLNISSNSVDYSSALPLLTEKLQRKMRRYSIDKPLNIGILIKGPTGRSRSPLVNIKGTTTGSKLVAPFGTFINASFEGYYTNQFDTTRERSDQNSAVTFKNLTCEWEKIPIESKTLLVTNLIDPFLDCDLKSNFDLARLNDLTGSNTLSLEGGKAKVDLRFKGSIEGRDSVASNIEGTVGIANAVLKYLPRNFTLRNCDGNLVFRNGDLFVEKITAQAGSTGLRMKGEARNFLSLLNISPEKLMLEWQIYSDEISVSDFKAFLSKNKGGGSQRKNAPLRAFTQRIDKMFTDGVISVNLTSPKIIYKKFLASDLNAHVLLSPTDIAFNKVRLNHANGEMNVDGKITDAGSVNQVVMRTAMNKLDIPKLFNAFENFGQDAITAANLRGTLTANILLNTSITPDGTVVSDNTDGIIDFLLERGELNHFEPVQKISEKAFKKQDFSTIQFADLKNTLRVKGSAFIIDRMEIRSTAITMFVEGIYDVKKGTDMSIQLPLRNLLKNQEKTDLSDDGGKGAGVAVRLRAKTGDDGKLSIKWDPFKRSLRKKQQVTDTLRATTEVP
jgi:hypothetical protein